MLIETQEHMQLIYSYRNSPFFLGYSLTISSTIHVLTIYLTMIPPDNFIDVLGPFTLYVFSLFSKYIRHLDVSII